MNIYIKNMARDTLNTNDNVCNIYCGRGAGRFGTFNAHLGNPFTVGVHGDRDECCDWYAQLLLQPITKGLALDTGYPVEHLEYLQKRHRSSIVQLRGLIRESKPDHVVLWCWCRPHRCHTTTIIRAIRAKL